MKAPKTLLGLALVLAMVLGAGLVSASAHDRRYYRHHDRVVIVRPPPVYAYGYYNYPRYYRPHPYVYGGVYPGVTFYGGPRYYHHHHHGWR